MKSVAAEERDIRIAVSMRNSFNIERLGRLKKLYGKLFFPLKLLSIALFGLLFILLPLCLFTDLSTYIRLGGLVISLLLIYTFTILYSYFVYRKIYRPTRGRGLLFTLMQVFSPMSAVHSSSHLTADLYHRFDYRAVAATLLSKETFSALAASELRKIRYAFKTSGPLELREYWILREKEIVQLVNQVGIKEHELMAPPLREDPLAIGFCPVCLAEYREGVTECSDCGIEIYKFRNNKND